MVKKQEIEARLQEAWKAGYENGKRHGFDEGFARAQKIARIDAEKVQQETEIKLQRAQAILSIAQAITHLT